MADGFLGADVDEVRDLAQAFDRAATRLQQQASQLSGAMGRMAAWRGADADRFRSLWNGSHRPTITNAASMLHTQSQVLLRQAEQQERASAVDGGGLPGGVSGGHPGTGLPGAPLGPGGTGGPSPFGPGWLADANSPFRTGWSYYGLAKAFPNMRSGVYDLARVGIRDLRGRSNFFSKAAFEALHRADPVSGLFKTSSDLFDGRLDEAFHLAEDGKAAKFFKVGGRALGVLDVGLNGLDTINAIRAGHTGEAVYDGAKTLIAAGSFLPPPAGTACMVASGALALYDNVPVIHDAVNAVGKGIGDAAGSVAKGVGDAAGKVADFFGF